MTKLLYVIMKAIPPGLVARKVPVKGQTKPFMGTRYFAVEEPEQFYMKQISSIPSLTPDEEHKLTVSYKKNRNKQAAKKLIESNLRMVGKIAHQFKSSGARFGDLIQEGNLGLIAALEKYDPSKGVRFTTFAYHYISGYMKNFIDVWLQHAKPEVTEMGGEENVEGEGRTPLLERMASQLPNPEEEVGEEQEKRYMGKKLTEALAKLNERERFVIQHRFLTEDRLTLEAVGDLLKLTKMRIKQLETEALNKMKANMGKSFYVLMSWLEDLQKAFRLAEFHGGEAEKKTRRKERDESGNWSQRDLRMRRLARRRKEETRPPSW